MVFGGICVAMSLGVRFVRVAVIVSAASSFGEELCGLCKCKRDGYAVKD